MRQIRNKRLMTLLIPALFLLVLSGLMGFTQPKAAGLPPRPEPTATPQPKSVTGGKIILQTSGLPIGSEGVWTAVQWQDPYTGKWHLVEGWQGTLEWDGSQTWWVGSADLGTGPFRWVIYAEKEGDELVISDSFNLPKKPGQTVLVTVPSE